MAMAVRSGKSCLQIRLQTLDPSWRRTKAHTRRLEEGGPALPQSPQHTVEGRIVDSDIDPSVAA